MIAQWIQWKEKLGMRWFGEWRHHGGVGTWNLVLTTIWDLLEVKRAGWVEEEVQDTWSGIIRQALE